MSLAGLHLGTELRRFGHGALPRLAIVTVMCLPLIFGGLFIWAYFDPIGSLNKLPVALVNSDAGAERPDGVFMRSGDQVAGELVDAQPLDFREASAQDALDGVVRGDYYFAVEIPEDFSAAVVSVMSDNPRSTTLNVSFSNVNGFIPTMLGNAATQAIVDAVRGVVGTEIANQMLVGFSVIGEGMDVAADGTEKLSEGAGAANKGAGVLSYGVGEVSENMKKTTAGAAGLALGAHALDEGIASAKSGADELAAGVDKLNAVTQQIGEAAGNISVDADKTSAITDAISNFQQHVLPRLVTASAQLRSTNLPGTAEIANLIDQLVADIGESPIDSGGQLERLRQGAQELTDRISGPVSQYRSGVEEAASGSKELASGLEKLQEGSTALTVGADTLAGGTSKLAAGSHQLTVGARALSDGLVQLDDGTEELALKVNEGAEKLPRQSEDKRDDAADAAANPVKRALTGEGLTPFGVGLAPFFISMALFMGGTIMFMVLRPVQQRALDSGTTPFRAVLVSYLPALLVGFAQAGLIWTVLQGLIEIEAAHPLALLVSMCGVSAVFVSITQAINAVVGATAGRVICLMFMALQLVSSGGLYPPETQPELIQTLHQWDPMRYSVDIFRECIVHSNVPGAVATNPRPMIAVAVLLLVLLICWAISSFCAWRGRVMPHKDLHPDLEL